MTTAPLVTVGISFANEERWLERAVRSILRQSMSDFELLLVDDGSTDRSLEIARSFEDSRVRVFSDGRRRHLAARLNQIIDSARGVIIARMDADDVSHPARLAQQLALLNGGDFDAVGSWAGLVSSDSEPFAVVEAHPASATPRQILEFGILPHPTLMAARSWFERFRYDERLTRTEDRDLWCRSAPFTRFGVVPLPLYALLIEPAEPSFLLTYLETQRQNRALFVRRGPEMVGWAGTVRAFARSSGKSALIRLANQLGLMDTVVRRRGRPPDASERTLILEALAAARD